MNAIGAFFSHGPQAGRFLFETYAALPKSRAKKKPRKSLSEIAAQHGLAAAQVGALDAGRLLAFVWKVAGRPAIFADGWKRKRPKSGVFCVFPQRRYSAAWLVET